MWAAGLLLLLFIQDFLLKPGTVKPCHKMEMDDERDVCMLYNTEVFFTFFVFERRLIMPYKQRTDVRQVSIKGSGEKFFFLPWYSKFHVQDPIHMQVAATCVSMQRHCVLQSLIALLWIFQRESCCLSRREQ